MFNKTTIIFSFNTFTLFTETRDTEEDTVVLVETRMMAVMVVVES